MQNQKVIEQRQKSHIGEEDQIWISFDSKGNTKIVKESQIVQQPGISYRKVHYTNQDKFKPSFWSKQKFFNDPEWPHQQIDVKIIDPYREVVLKRLIKLYTKNTKPMFFPQQQSFINRNLNPKEVPPCLKQMHIFGVEHYKSLFLTQDFQQSGLYQILINVDGRWETDVVDDYIPVYKDTEQPIWGMDIGHPWAIILLKFWAKRWRGYAPIKDTDPMQFIQCFTNSNWKYYNFGKDGLAFLDYYEGKAENGKMIAKTKDSTEVEKAGLVANSCGYEILDIKQTQQSPSHPSHFLVTLKSVLKNRWAGKMSVVDKKINNVYDSRKNSLRLERDFIMNGQDFVNFFVSGYVASKREMSDHYSSYYLLNIPANQKNAIYLQFQINKAQGFFDFAIKQFKSNKMIYDQNKSKLASQSNIGRSRFGTASKIPGQRFMALKYMLVYNRQNLSMDNTNNVRENQSLNEKNSEFYIPKFEVYDIDYHRGYGPGEAHFNKTQKGKYILRIKPENVPRQTQFVINYCSNCKFDMKEKKLNKQETSEILRQSMISVLDKVPRMSLDNSKKQEAIAFGNTFEDIGYGYIAIKSKKSNSKDVLLQFDPAILNEEGYYAKSQFKNNKEPFSIIVRPGQSTAVIFKKKGNNDSKPSSWPPKNGLKIFTQSLK